MLSRLHAAGLIADPVGRAKSVVLVAERPGDVWMLVVRDEAGPPSRTYQSDRDPAQTAAAQRG